VVVRTVAALARSLALATVAEGVETPAQLAELRALECEYAQGYLFAPPLLPEEVPDFVASGRRW
jgi:EAL domain-containing protein (putative c-di-GMP-specific phosphodiesterase class I)